SDDFLEDARRARPVAAEAISCVSPVQQPSNRPPSSDSSAPAVPAQIDPIEGGEAEIAAPPLAAAPRTLGEAEIDMIRNALETANGNISVASRRLGISRNTIYRKLKWGKDA
ncbi:MAG: helix-turn-helix domain-containing protein, partial [Variovorax sp.]